MTTDVIILAQGSQKRMGTSLVGGVEYKQLLPLPACGGVSILARTIRMLANIGLVGQRVHVACDSRLGIRLDDELKRVHGAVPIPDYFALHNPGNSSLKGLDRALATLGMDNEVGSTVVLLGDVCYSHDCVRATLSMTRPSGYGFVGTSDLGGGGGELWSVAWAPSGSLPVIVQSALKDHPPFEEYQPGQLRRLLVHSRLAHVKPTVEHARERLRVNGRYIAIDDYTMDVDLPQHIAALGPASEAAAKDDEAHGILW
jgi:hypothetical protein